MSQTQTEPPPTDAPDARAQEPRPQDAARSYYGYLFEADKKPTKVLDALLRAIAAYISEEIGSKDEKALTPDKLAAFYKAVGGNYDSLFVDVPYPSISWIYASIGCQHSLLPNPSSDFEPPSVPALTPRGFVRWQSIEILLGPEEHVPFIQNAIRLFPLINPLTKTPFPLPLPKEAFPLVPDADIAKWHDQCARALRQRASPTEDEPRPNPPPRPKVEATYVHVRPTRPRVDSHADYFEREPKSMRVPLGGRPMSYNHVSSTGVRGNVPIPVRPVLSRSPSHRARQFLAPEHSMNPRVNRGRRASFPENGMSGSGSSPMESPVYRHSGAPSPREGMREENVRRHSHPRHAARRGIDANGKLSAPFLLGKRDRERDRKARSSSHSGGSAGNVRWKDLDDDAVKELWKSAGSGGSVEEDIGAGGHAAGRHRDRERLGQGRTG
ncbi:uncharacterized protein L3040_007746 [Drepanopeziza brunnea f. sp. 'multigermtubi']|uniref:uncharacterized protein n=1 Tax=Drepanopeziza brunnea f. sp. 'multigermtubi' TaxID=698441 RepID=UPI00239CF185|nr:hypothetical protein L3040_007746 [Drepanopeziza brunnea f. sp. 'multigermtubi']